MNLTTTEFNNKKMVFNQIPTLSKKKLNISNLYQSSDTKNKNLFIKELPNILKNNIDDYRIYYVTLTFMNTKYAVPYAYYKKFFDEIRKKLYKGTLSNLKMQRTKPHLIFLPEKSHKNSKGLFTPLHFHGFFLVQKSNIERFERRCVERFYYEFYEEKNHENRNIILKDRFFEIQNDHLILCTSKITELSSMQDIYRTCSYNGKGFLSRDFTWDDVIGI